ncbi:hypothetical protein ANN_14108 [Periplaneta americana]|uniref:Uncharacterized protein n=1 Tax=Periplaneta americana TaxID=6978 RepID=A0ABQ8SWF0_PERAM|nr:hypothetical protein ANN_14108 [Periplaneta americana]
MLPSIFSYLVEGKARKKPQPDLIRSEITEDGVRVGNVETLTGVNVEEKISRDLDIKEKDMNRIKATEMKFFRRTAEYTLLDRKRNEEMLEQLQVESVEEKISRYKFKWLDHIFYVIMMKDEWNGEKFSPVQEFEPEFSALRADAISTKPHRISIPMSDRILSVLSSTS